MGRAGCAKDRDSVREYVRRVRTVPSQTYIGRCALAATCHSALTVVGQLCCRSDIRDAFHCRYMVRTQKSFVVAPCVCPGLYHGITFVIWVCRYGDTDNGGTLDFHHTACHGVCRQALEEARYLCRPPHRLPPCIQFLAVTSLSYLAFGYVSCLWQVGCFLSHIAYSTFSRHGIDWADSSLLIWL